MPFRPVNTLSFYSCMMGKFKEEYDVLFVKMIKYYASLGHHIDGKVVLVLHGDIFIGKPKSYSGTTSIISSVLGYFRFLSKLPRQL